MTAKEKLKSWIARETGKKYVIYALGVIAFFESFIFPIPVDTFIFGLTLAQRKKWLSYATVATTFSVLGAVFGYFLGAYLFDEFGQKFIELYGYQEQFKQVTLLFEKNTFLVMFMSAFTPIPYKVFTVAGGALGVPLLPFIIASILGRGLRFYAEAYLAQKFGKKVTEHIFKKINFYSFVFALAILAFIIYRSL